MGDEVDKFAEEHHAPVIAEFVSITTTYPVYLLRIHGREICLCQVPCGAAPATQIMDRLLTYGVITVISTDPCGVMCDLPENTFLIPERAHRDEGTSFHYLPADRYVALNGEMIEVMKSYFDSRRIPYQICTTWTTDGFFRETRNKVAARHAEGCTAVEMECASLTACAVFRGARFGQFLFTADTLASLDAYDARNRGDASLRPALRMAVEMAITVDK